MRTPNYPIIFNVTLGLTFLNLTIPLFKLEIELLISITKCILKEKSLLKRTGKKRFHVSFAVKTTEFFKQ